MQQRNVPASGPSYWGALIVASALGCNLGDMVSHNLHLGHQNGVLPVLCLFALILLAERLSGLVSVAFYWLAILALRTVATNLGDLLTHELHLTFPVAIAAMALVLLPLVWLAARRGGGQSGLPPNDLLYWATMLVAGTLGTVIGDCFADDVGLGDGGAAVLQSVILAGMLALRGRPGFATIGYYWACIVGVRAAGTSIGDALASRHALGLGLPLSAGLTATLLVIVLVATHSRAAKPAQP